MEEKYVDIQDMYRILYIQWAQGVNRRKWRSYLDSICDIQAEYMPVSQDTEEPLQEAIGLGYRNTTPFEGQQQHTV